MFAKYAWLAGATAANVLADVCKLIAGAAIADLSASADKANCTLGGVAPGWSYDDAGYGIVSAPAEDGAARKVYQLSIAGSVLKASAMGSWNVATHAASDNTTALGDAVVNVANAGVVYVMACAEAAAVYDSSGGFIVLVEISRDGPFMKNKPVAAVMKKQDYNVYMPRVKSPKAAGHSVNFIASIDGLPIAASVSRDDSEATIYQTCEAFAVSNGSIFGRVRGVVILPAVGAIGDIFTDGATSVRYFVNAQRAFGVVQK